MRLADYIATLVAARQQLQLLHWQTRLYASHKALGHAVDALTENIDKYVEVACGAEGIHPGDLPLAPALAQRCGTISAWESPKEEGRVVADIRRKLAAGRKVSAAAAYIVDEMVGGVSRAEYLLAIEAGFTPARRSSEKSGDRKDQ